MPFGIKFNSKNGGPAIEALTDRIYEESKIITTIKDCDVPEIDINKLGSHETLLPVEGFTKLYKVAVVDSCNLYVDLMRTLFDFNLLK